MNTEKRSAYSLNRRKMSKKTSSATKSVCRSRNMKGFAVWQVGKGLKVRRKSLWKCCCRSAKNWAATKLTEAQKQVRQAETENEVLKEQVNALRRELHSILTAHPEIKKEQEKALSSVERQIC